MNKESTESTSFSTNPLKDLDITDLDEKLISDLRQLKLLQGIMDISPSFLVIKDRDLVYREVSKSFCKFLGKSRNQIIGKTDFDLFPENEAEEYQATDRKAFYSKNPIEGDWKVSGKDCKRWLHIVKNIFSSPNGKPVGILCSATDINERKEAEKKIRDSHQQLLSVFSGIDELIYVADFDTYEMLYMNEKAIQIMGNHIGKKCYEALQNFNSPCKFCTNHLISKENLGKTQIWEFQNKKNKHWYRCIDKAILWTNNKYVRFEMAVDITDKKVFEKKLLQLSFHDKLTGLYNRAYYQEESKRLDSKRNLPISLLMADVNGLKLVNDAFGHHHGDKLLQLTAETLKECCRDKDIVARYGGDEFVILLSKTPKSRVEEIIENIKNITPTKKSTHIPLSLSIGFAIKTSEKTKMVEVLKEAEENMYKDKLINSKKAYKQMIEFLTNSLYEKGIEKRKHHEKVEYYSKILGKSIGLSKYKLTELALHSKLHDIGKIGIKKEILQKEGRLNKDEWEYIKKHSEIGYRIANSSPLLSPISEYILHQHEWWDGSGYPNGLKKEDIPLISRIVAIVDAYDTMVSKKPYKNKMSKEMAIKELKKCAGIQFDPYLVKKFIAILREENN